MITLNHFRECSDLCFECYSNNLLKVICSTSNLKNPLKSHFLSHEKGRFIIELKLMEQYM